MAASSAPTQFGFPEAEGAIWSTQCRDIEHVRPATTSAMTIAPPPRREWRPSGLGVSGRYGTREVHGDSNTMYVHHRTAPCRQEVRSIYRRRDDRPTAKAHDRRPPAAARAQEGDRTVQTSSSAKPATTRPALPLRPRTVGEPGTNASTISAKTDRDHAHSCSSLVRVAAHGLSPQPTSTAPRPSRLCAHARSGGPRRSGLGRIATRRD